MESDLQTSSQLSESTVIPSKNDKKRRKYTSKANSKSTIKNSKDGKSHIESDTKSNKSDNLNAPTISGISGEDVVVNDQISCENNDVSEINIIEFAPQKSSKIRSKSLSRQHKDIKSKLKLSRKSNNALSNSLNKSNHNPEDVMSCLESNSKQISVKSSMDAFQVMMEARKKSIGMNSPGKEMPVDNNQQDLSSQKELKAKRFLSLSQWADKKGASKKREMEVLQDQQIKNALNKRAENFKEMLNKNIKKVIPPQSPNSKLKQNVEEFECIFKIEAHKKKRICENKGEKVRKKIKLQSCDDSEETNSEVLAEPTNISKKIVKCVSSTSEDDFMEKLSPSLKKKESMLCYFEKIVENQDTDSIEVVEVMERLDEEAISSKVLKVKIGSKSKKKLSLKKTRKNTSKKETMNIDSDKVLDTAISKAKHSQAVVHNEDLNVTTDKSKDSQKLVHNKDLTKHLQKVSRNKDLTVTTDNSKDLQKLVHDEDLIVTTVKSKHSQKVSRKKDLIVTTDRSQDSQLVHDKDLIVKTKKSKHSQKIVNSKKKKRNGDNILEIQRVVENSSLNLDSQRPKRTVRKPVKYIQDESDKSDSDSEDLDINKYNIFSPVKKKKHTANGKICTKEDKNKISKNKNKENVITIEIDDKVSPIKIINLQSPGNLKCTRSPRTTRKDDVVGISGKLAPMFRKSLPKPKVDPSVLEARKMFLQSGVPESIKKHFDKPSTALNDCTDFHLVCHVQQNDTLDYVENLSSTPLFLDYSYVSNCSVTQGETNDFKQFVCDADKTKVPISFGQIFRELQHYDIVSGLKRIKNEYPSFPVYRIFKGLWEKYSGKSKFLLSDKSYEGISNFDDSLWTEKYKPLASCDILGNTKSVNSIKRWLESWKEYNELAALKVSRRPRRDSGSSCDFNTSDSESRDSWRTPNNLMIITGTPGSGKTSCIYAIANELGINVLEVNASSKRTGKKILSELHEATQSHKVLTKINSESSINTDDKFDSNKSKTKLKNDPLLNKKHKKSSQNDSNVLSNIDLCSQKSSETNVMSLMLIDDADVVFDEDDGFVGALLQLVQSSKRPVVIVTSDINCLHLQRFINENNVVYFRPLSGKLLGPWLDILLLIECNKFFTKLSNALIEVNKGDMRSSIHQLQYWVQGLKRTSDLNKEVCNGECEDANDNLTPDIDEELKNEDVVFTQSKDKNELNANKRSLCLFKSDSEVHLEYLAQKALLFDLPKTGGLGIHWWNSHRILHSDKVTETIETSSEVCHLNDVKVKSYSHELKSISSLFDCLSDVDLIQSCSGCNLDDSDPAKPLWQKNLKDSISEVENSSMFKGHENISRLWCQYMTDYYSNRIKEINDREYDDLAFVNFLDVRLQEKKRQNYSNLLDAVSCGSKLDRSALSLDYLSSLRSICRSEKNRSENNFKRNNRFHNYLNTLNITANENVLSDICNIFQIKPL